MKHTPQTKRFLSLILVIAMILSLVPGSVFAADSPTTLYLKPNSNWKVDNARFAMYCFGNGEKWVDMSDPDSDGIYEAAVPAGFPSVIFCRMNPSAAANNWGNKWNQTADLTVPTDGTNLYTVKEDTWDKGGGSWSTYTPPVPETTAPPETTVPQEPENETITVYFRNDWLWSEVCAYYWGSDIQGPEWPGDKMTFVEAINGQDIYTAEIPAGATGLLFNGIKNDGSGKSDQTPDITDFADGDAYYIHWANEANQVSKFTYPTTSEPEPEPGPVTDVTVHYRNTGMWSTVNYHAWIENGDNDQGLTSWPGTEVTENAEHKNWYTVTLSDLNAENGIGILFNDGNGSQTGDIYITANGDYWYDGQLLTEEPDTWADGTVPSVDYKATLHFANAHNWGTVNLYTWGSTGTYSGAWPGSAAGLDSDGFYSLDVTYTAPEGQGLSFIFNGNGGQTIDLALGADAFTEIDGVYTTERWVVPTTTDTEGKFYADIVTDSEAIAISPVVDGQTVTFEYKASHASSVTVAGTMNDWTPAEMIKNDHGVWSVTLNDVAFGVHQYKFIVDGLWLTDPLNGWIYTEQSGNQNSAFLISNPELDNNKVKINVHYSNTSEWNVCAWGAVGLDPQYNFVDGVTTITLDGRSNQYVAFKVRKSVPGNDWAEQSGEIRVDLGSIVSGTIDVYVGGDFSVSQRLNADVVYANKVSSVELNYDTGVITVVTTKAVSGNAADTFRLVDSATGETVEVSVTGNGSTYVLTPTIDIPLTELYRYKVNFLDQIEKFQNYEYTVGINTVYASDRFGEEFTYEGTDLGATWSETDTDFRVWAPTAESVTVNLYESGTKGTDDLIGSYEMTASDNGTWVANIPGDLNGTYYTYSVKRDGVTVEAVDPYARTTGVNGNRGMVIDLDSTDPTGWDTDTDPNPLASYTDAIIYELHVRDFSIDDSSGVRDKWQGKFLALTQEGTTTANGTTTGLDYLKELGITHLHLLPVYDYASVDETKCENFNWGYDPLNYNVPEGSYSTDPYHGEVRVEEFKEMVSALHDAGISVIMDVVYNHVYDAGVFSINQIVPGYFSRTNADGSYSNGSGCGNDTASEREMVRKYIVESVNYWADEYHVDGFRFDLVGLLDATTINMIVETVHEDHPGAIFYGEGWTLGTAVEPGNTMATQANSAATPEFAYFSDTIRNLLGGSNGQSKGFVTGETQYEEDAVAANFLANPWWTQEPQQIIQYASCHDNYTLVDKLILSTKRPCLDEQVIRMNNLAAAVYLTAQGIPFIHAGEEFLREKLEEDGGRCENSYNASDYVNHIEWSNLDKENYAKNSDYYQALIAFRKAHPALRLSTRELIDANVKYDWMTDNVLRFTINGSAVGDPAEQICVIFNATQSAKYVDLPAGDWTVAIDMNGAADKNARGSVEVPGISAMILVKGENEFVAWNEDDDLYYTDLSDGLAAASTGDTVKLLKQTEEALVLVPAGVTFDLNGNVVKADNVLSFGVVMDSAEVTGGIEISIDTTQAFTRLQPSNGGYLPIYDTTCGMFKFYAFVMNNIGYIEAPNSVKFGFRYELANKEGYEVLKRTTNSGLKLDVMLSWTGISSVDVVCHITDDTMRKYAQEGGHFNKKGIEVTLYGLSKLGAGGYVSESPVLTSITGVTATDDTITYIYNG